jgi:hypothetical protein
MGISGHNLSTTTVRAGHSRTDLRFRHSIVEESRRVVLRAVWCTVPQGGLRGGRPPLFGTKKRFGGKRIDEYIRMVRGKAPADENQPGS